MTSYRLVTLVQMIASLVLGARVFHVHEYAAGVWLCFIAAISAVQLVVVKTVALNPPNFDAEWNTLYKYADELDAYAASLTAREIELETARPFHD